MAEQKPKFVIKAEDLQRAEVSNTVDHIKRAKEIVLVRNVGTETGNKDGLLTIGVLTGAGLLSGLATWAIWQPLTDMFKNDTTATSADLAVSVSLSVVVALFLVAADAGLSRSIQKLGRYLLIAIPVALVTSFGLGYIASNYYSGAVKGIYTEIQERIASGEVTNESQAVATLLGLMHMPRGLAWALLGLAAGIAVGITALSIKRVLITAAGGLVGGFIGGFLFDYFQGEAIAQISGLVITGGAVGLAVSLLEQVTKSSWLEIVKGGMAGKQFILYQNSITLGSSPSANITLIKDNAIPPIAALIKKFGNNVTISSAAPGVAISVDGVSAFEHRLKEGSLIVLGGTEVRFRERSKQINNSSIQRG
jgi:hypothetical protein